MRESGSPTRFTQSSCTGTSVSGMPTAAARKMHTTSPMLELTMYRMNCLVLAKMARPSATACQATPLSEQGHSNSRVIGFHSGSA